MPIRRSIARCRSILITFRSLNWRSSCERQLCSDRVDMDVPYSFALPEVIVRKWISILEEIRYGRVLSRAENTIFGLERQKRRFWWSGARIENVFSRLLFDYSDETIIELYDHSVEDWTKTTHLSWADLPWSPQLSKWHPSARHQWYWSLGRNVSMSCSSLRVMTVADWSFASRHCRSVHLVRDRHDVRRRWFLADESYGWLHSEMDSHDAKNVFTSGFSPSRWSPSQTGRFFLARCFKVIRKTTPIAAFWKRFRISRRFSGCSGPTVSVKKPMSPTRRDMRDVRLPVLLLPSWDSFPLRLGWRFSMDESLSTSDRLVMERAIREKYHLSVKHHRFDSPTTFGNWSSLGLLRSVGGIGTF